MNCNEEVDYTLSFLKHPRVKEIWAECKKLTELSVQIGTCNYIAHCDHQLTKRV